MITGGHKIIDMKTEIKTEDILHLYLGFECHVHNSRQLNRVIGIHTNGNVQVSHAQAAQDKFEAEYVTLILRPLSDITEEEKEDVHKIRDENFTSPTLETYGRVTQYLLRKGFDVFGLIESGKAKDKTKM